MAIVVARRAATVTLVGRSLAGLAMVPCALLVGSEAKHLFLGGPLLPGGQDLWLRMHLLAVIPSYPLGAWVLLARKGDRRHRLLGRVWSALMLAVALSSYGLRDAGGAFSSIHLLSIALLIGLPLGLRQAIKGEIASHRWTMTRLYGALVAAGLFAFVPSRTLGAWVFG